MENLKEEALENVTGGKSVEVQSSNDGTAWCPYDKHPLDYRGIGGWKNRYWYFKCPLCGKMFLKSRMDNTWTEQE